MYLCVYATYTHVHSLTKHMYIHIYIYTHADIDIDSRDQEASDSKQDPAWPRRTSKRSAMTSTRSGPATSPGQIAGRRGGQFLKLRGSRSFTGG